MYLNHFSCDSQSRRAIQRGFLIPLALVIIVGLSILALALGKIASQAGTSSIQEAVSAQAFYAAESGAQFGMNQLFFPDDTRAIVDANCSSFPLSRTFTVPGLNGCSVNVTCLLSNDTASLTSYYVLNSTASCGAGNITAQRTIQVSSFAR